ncbi:hypothetical protein [Polyangium aurulentum]|uniref:hypothetical protein n=1 Tax=Polyangium aurulentum TaxID=2567896 RepID=UPI0010AE86BB|nr:hypothetical protein [Polyangium aurulentum]UQA56424.1 hypothetical protein E8A73_034685 [Polyangium aurulentum]
MRAWHLSLLLMVPAAVAAASCALEAFEKVEDVPEKPVCGHALAPSPPAVTNAGGDETFVVALKTLRLQEIAGADAGPLGLDLDRFCTCETEGPSCIAPMGQPDGGSCDGIEGRDNAVEGLFTQLAGALNKQDMGAFYSEFAGKGVWSVLFRVRGYNGQPNDDQVRLDWYVSGGFGAQPLWDGTDAWPIAAKSLPPGSTDLEQPRYFDPKAYVTDGVLVASLPEGAVMLGGGLTNIELRLTTGTLMARIQKGADGRYSLVDSLLAMRIKIEDVFLMLSSFRNEEGHAFCTDDLLWSQIIKRNICLAPDIQAGAPEPNKPCNAVSFSMGFDAYPAQLGALVPDPPPPPGCPMATDPIYDSCEAKDAGAP